MSMRGRFVWEELTTTNLEAGAKFYAAVAGLKTAPAPFDASYTTFLAGKSPVGGLFPLPEEAKAMGAPPNWLSYIGTDNVDETTRHAQSLGAKVIKPAADIANGGRFAILQDPQGAVFAIYASPQPYQAPASIPFGGMSWHELATSDMNTAFPFYQQLFGWHIVSDNDMGAMGTYRLFAPEGSKDAFGGMYSKPPEPPRPSAWLPYIKVADCKKATAKAKSLGATIFHGPAEVPGGGWITMGADLQGAAFALHQSGTPAAASKPKPTPKAKSKATLKAKPKVKSAKKKAPPKRKQIAKKAAPRRAKRKAGSKK
jgi:predicted enzyme related to lactoylglutathione lyase